MRAKPSARHNQLLRAADGGLVVRPAAPAHDGQANAALLVFLAKVLGVSKSRVLLRSGPAAPFKKIEVLGLAEEAGRAALARPWGRCKAPQERRLAAT